MDGGREQGNLCCEGGRKLGKKEEGRKFRLDIYNVLRYIIFLCFNKAVLCIFCTSVYTRNTASIALQGPSYL